MKLKPPHDIHSCYCCTKALNGANYWFGGLNQSNLKLSKWLMVGPRPGLVQTIDYWFGLLVNGPKAFMILTHNNNTK